jgi:hypothetical protein
MPEPAEVAPTAKNGCEFIFVSPPPSIISSGGGGRIQKIYTYFKIFLKETPVDELIAEMSL